MLIRKDVCGGARKPSKGMVNTKSRINVHFWGSWWEQEDVTMEAQD